jgi:PAS domain S-box-containing protein
LTFNAASQNIFGYSPDEVIGSNIKALITEECHHEFDDYLDSFKEPRAMLSSNDRRELNGIRKDISEFPMDFAVGIMDSESQRMFVGVVRDITERNALDRIKNEFISTVSHELRTPLTSIKGSLGLIASGAVGDLPDSMQTMLKISLQNSDRLILLINDILDMEKILLGKMELQFKPTDLAELVNEAIELNEGYADEYGITFTRVRCDEESTVLGDRDRLMQVLTNLISNAAKFSNEGGQVELYVERHKGAIRVSVKDYGIGIPDAFRDHIFEKFAQVDMTSSRQKGGTGLGLNISKALIEKHGGTLDFETEVDTGSTFHFTLPALP